MLTEVIERKFTVACDGLPTCPTPPIVTTTEARLAGILRAQGWRLTEVGGKIDRTQPTYCKACTAALQAAGKLQA